MTTKSTATLHSRANPMLRFIKWCKYNALQPFPMDHVVVFKHLQMIKDTCAPTLAKSVLWSSAFIIFCMGLASGKKVLEPCEWKKVLESAMVSGLSASLFLRKRKALQRPPFESLACEAFGVVGMWKGQRYNH